MKDELIEAIENAIIEYSTPFLERIKKDKSMLLKIDKNSNLYCECLVQFLYSCRFFFDSERNCTKIDYGINNKIGTIYFSESLRLLDMINDFASSNNKKDEEDIFFDVKNRIIIYPN